MNRKRSSGPVFHSLLVMSLGILLLDAFYATSMLGAAASMALSFLLVVLSVFAIAFTNLRSMLAGVFAISICLSVWTSHWPMHVRFQLAKPAFEARVAEIQNGKYSATPCWIGSYRVLRIDNKAPDKICFWTDLNIYGNSGVVHCQNADRSFNVMILKTLGGSWHLLTED